MGPTLPYLLIVLSLAVLAGELLLPGGVLFVLGVTGLVAGLAMLFSHDAVQGLVTLVVLGLALPVLGPLLLQLWRVTPFGRRLTLDAPAAEPAAPAQRALAELRGRYGRTASPLRPAGVTEFDGRRVDTLSEGPLIEAGQWVRCVDVRDGRVIVRPAPAPPALADFDPKDLSL